MFFIYFCRRRGGVQTPAGTIRRGGELRPLRTFVLWNTSTEKDMTGIAAALRRAVAAAVRRRPDRPLALPQAHDRRGGDDRPAGGGARAARRTLRHGAFGTRRGSARRPTERRSICSVPCRGISSNRPISPTATAPRSASRRRRAAAWAAVSAPPAGRDCSIRSRRPRFSIRSSRCPNATV